MDAKCNEINSVVDHWYSLHNYCNTQSVITNLLFIFDILFNILFKPCAAELVVSIFHSKLELVTQFPASNDKKVDTFQIEKNMNNMKSLTNYFINFCCILFGLKLISMTFVHRFFQNEKRSGTFGVPACTAEPVF